MMLAALEQPSEIDVFSFFLAEKLGKTVGEIEEMPALEILHWQSYYKVKHVHEDLALRTAAKR